MVPNMLAAFAFEALQYRPRNDLERFGLSHQNETSILTIFRVETSPNLASDFRIDITSRVYVRFT